MFGIQILLEGYQLMVFMASSLRRKHFSSIFSWQQSAGSFQTIWINPEIAVGKNYKRGFMGLTGSAKPLAPFVFSLRR